MRRAHAFAGLTVAVAVAAATVAVAQDRRTGSTVEDQFVLPVPEGPSITEISPAGRVSVTSFQMVWEPNRLVSPSTLISTPTVHLVVVVLHAREGPGLALLNDHGTRGLRADGRMGP